jgi:hypothetical protein
MPGHVAAVQFANHFAEFSIGIYLQLQFEGKFIPTFIMWNFTATNSETYDLDVTDSMRWSTNYSPGFYNPCFRVHSQV